MSDPYVTWGRNLPLATDKPDGFPDRVMVPLVEALRDAGFTTYQSCSGHFQEGDGTLWIKEGPHKDRWPDQMWFQRIQHVWHGPEGDYWEYHWESHDVVRALCEIARTYGVDALTGDTE